jgi:hypothetical protein
VVGNPAYESRGIAGDVWGDFDNQERTPGVVAEGSEELLEQVEGNGAGGVQYPLLLVFLLTVVVAAGESKKVTSGRPCQSGGAFFFSGTVPPGLVTG